MPHWDKELISIFEKSKESQRLEQRALGKSLRWSRADALRASFSAPGNQTLL
jgi:hypothetical protein